MRAAHSAQRNANEAAPTAADTPASDSNGAQNPFRKPDKGVLPLTILRVVFVLKYPTRTGKQRMQDDDASTPSTAGTGSDPKGTAGF